jgi:hypothetical protein
VLGRRRERLRDDLEKFGHADVVRRRRREHRVETAARDRLLQILNQALDLDLLTGKVGLHQGLVFALLDDRLDQRAAGFIDTVGLVSGDVGLRPLPAGVVVEALREQTDEAPNPALGIGHRQVQRSDGIAERGSTGRQRFLEVAALMVDLGDHDSTRGANGRALVPEHLGQAIDTIGRGHRKQSRVGGAKAGPQIPGEVGIARRVEEVHLDVVVHEGDERQVHRALLSDLDLIEVADGAAVLDSAFALDRAGRDQKGLGQRRLSCSRVADQHHVAHAFGLAGR